MASAPYLAGIKGWKQMTMRTIPMQYVREKVSSLRNIPEVRLPQNNMDVISLLDRGSLASLAKECGDQFQHQMYVAYNKDWMDSGLENPAVRIHGVIMNGSQGLKGAGGIPVFDNVTFDEALVALNTAVEIFKMESDKTIGARMNMDELSASIDVPFFWWQMGLLVQEPVLLGGGNAYRISRILSPILDTPLATTSLDHPVYDFVSALVTENGLPDINAFLLKAYNRTMSHRLFSNSLRALLMNGCGQKLQDDLFDTDKKPEIVRNFGAGRMIATLLNIINGPDAPQEIHDFFAAISTRISGQAVSADKEKANDRTNVARRIYLLMRNEMCTATVRQLSMITGAPEALVQEIITADSKRSFPLFTEIKPGVYRVSSN